MNINLGDCTMGDEDNEQPNVMNLRVVSSPVKISGSTRVHDAVLEKLGMEEKEQLSIHYDGQTILRTLFADDHIEKDAISLRKDAMSKLSLSEGEIVVVGSRDDMKEYLRILREKEEEED